MQLAGWLAYGLISALGALPYQNAYPVLLYFAGTTAAGFLASLPLLRLCRRLAASRASWPKTFGAIIASSYALGILCSLTGSAIEAKFGHATAGAPHWRSVALIGFANAFSPTIMLVAWSALYRGAWHWREMRQREQQLLVAESLARDAELKALRYQITPHFLFNTLNGISTLVGEGQIRPARRMISLLADFLRSTLEPAQHGDVTLAEELRQVRQYIDIEQIRLGQRMQATTHCTPDVEEAFVPHLLLQPLVENAIRHGIAPRLEGGALSVAVSGNGDFVRIMIHNSYGATPDPWAVSRSPDSATGGGLGLANTVARLTARYGDTYRFSSAGDGGQGWTVVIDIPRGLTADARP